MRERRRLKKVTWYHTEVAPWRMGPRLIHATFSDLPEAVLVRSVLMRLIGELEAGGEPQIRGSVRTLGYRYVLPVWTHAYGADRSTWDRRLTRTLAALILRQGATNYTRLGITYASWEQRRIGTDRPEVIVFAEDHSLVRLMREIHTRHGVTTLITGAFPRASTAEYTARHVTEAMAGGGRRRRRVRLLSLHDYDVHGWDGARSFQRHLEHFGLGPSALEQLVRPDVLPDELVRRLRVPLRRRGAMSVALSRWMAEAGGIAGQPAKLEATAVPPQLLMALVTRALAR